MRFFKVLLFLSLAGCTAAPAPTPPPAVENEPKIVERQPLEAPPPRQPEALPEKPRAQIAVAQPAKPINDDPKQLFGLDAHKVAALLGPANFVRRDGPAEVWQYRADACVLDVYLYREEAGLTVAHVDLRKRLKAAQPPRRCFLALLSRQK
jgi:hypothetical protein